ncbi:hypothetical protein ANCCAN_25747 [Ancylostoma caninum]|uniref:Uncharacterized protein n=1 Tax=Ancylostoma caninum TaxID=29170 RepID=A0A368FBX1_ANCCA|nr:hypothetical protein ANCCAN_25747 [Ancylostoma caninum]
MVVAVIQLVKPNRLVSQCFCLSHSQPRIPLRVLQCILNEENHKSQHHSRPAEFGRNTAVANEGD